MRNTRLKHFAALILFVGFSFSMAGWLYSREGLFRLSRIEVDGVALDKRAAYEKLLIEFYGESLFSLNLDKIKSKILSHPRVAGLSLHRIWPGTLRVRIHESPAVALFQDGKETFFIDRNCNKLSLVDTPENLPLLKASELSSALEACRFFSEVVSSGDGSLSWKGQFFDEAEWSLDRGLDLRSHDISTVVRMGRSPTLRSWQRALFSLNFLLEKQIFVSSLDVSFRSRVVYEIEEASSKNPILPTKLQFPRNELTLKELERRTLSVDEQDASMGAR